MPATFGNSSIYGNKFSIYCTYIPGSTSLLKFADITLGIDSVSSNNFEVQIYPNPTTGLIQIKFSRQPETESWISIFNCSGEMISKIKATNQDEVLSLNGNPPGIYLIKIDQKESKTYKVVLQ
jgi:hypothetical protein